MAKKRLNPGYRNLLKRKKEQGLASSLEMILEVRSRWDKKPPPLQGAYRTMTDLFSLRRSGVRFESHRWGSGFVRFVYAEDVQTYRHWLENNLYELETDVFKRSRSEIATVALLPTADPHESVDDDVELITSSVSAPRHGAELVVQAAEPREEQEQHGHPGWSRLRDLIEHQSQVISELKASVDMRPEPYTPAPTQPHKGKVGAFLGRLLG